MISPMPRHFVIAGAQRSGTTYLRTLLEQHPDICMAKPVRPEPKFFLDDDAVALGYDTYLARYFAHCEGQALLGEKSTSYIEREDAIPRIRSVLPAAQIVFVLRDPVLRAYSNWRFTRSHGLEPLTFPEALRAEDARLSQWDRTHFSVSPYAYATRGHYARYLDSWVQQFPREQIAIVTTEGLTGNDRVRQEVLRRLGVAPGPLPSPSARVNASADDGTGDMPDDVRIALRERYREDSRRLSDEWGVDTSPWQ
jgi:hypothetical protein